MVSGWSFRHTLLFLAAFLTATLAFAQQAGSIRGIIYDQDFDVPLAAAVVTIAETGQRVEATDQGNYLIEQMPTGTYTLVFSKDGYSRQVRADVVVTAGRLTEVDASLSGDFTDMEEFVVQEIELAAGTEQALLELRMESPALMDSISADFMSQAGASDAASALTLVAGATVQEGKYAVIRGLPDRYVNSQMNGVRLPTADPDKRAVELDQFPAAAIESIQVSKTFTPDQQGDASGGAVNVVLKGIPEETTLKISGGTSYNTQASYHNEFLTYQGGEPNYWGDEDRDIQTERIGESWDGAVGVSTDDSPIDYKWSVEAGTKYEFENGIRVGGVANFFYERDSSYYDDGIDDKYWLEERGEPMTPQKTQATAPEDFKTSLFDVTQGTEEVKWGALGAVGFETENHSITFVNLYTRVAETKATLAEDTRGKQFFYPGYSPDDQEHLGNAERRAAPYLRTETLEYTERITKTMQLSGRHKLPDPHFGWEAFLMLLGPEIDWTLAQSSAELYQPDKRQFGTQWFPGRDNPGVPPHVPPSTDPPIHRPYKPAANFTLGNLQRTWRDIVEDSDQYSANIKFPFEQWTGDEGYVKFGVFYDDVKRAYNQDSFSNFNDNSASYEGDWEDYWSEDFPGEDHPVTAAEIDVDYEGEQNIKAWYYMVDVPLTSFFSVQGGTRFEDTVLSITNTPEEDVTWFPPDSPGSVKLNPGDADVAFEQSDQLPSVGFRLTPIEQVVLRGNYSETVARQTFKELTPIQQQEFLGGDVFIGNPFLQMSQLKNYDLRLDYTPYDGGLVSFSWFKKDITDPIEYVQRISDFDFTTPVNYPEGQLEGYELEIRQHLGQFWDPLEGLSIGANGTLIESEVTLPDDEQEDFSDPNLNTPIETRDMTNAPEHLYNLYFTYDLDKLGLAGTQVSLFYTVRGDTLVAGVGQAKGNFIPDVYETEYGTLNFSLSKEFGEFLKVKLQAKNLLDPEIETVYRSEFIDEDVTKTSYRKGREFSISLTASF